MHAMRVLHLFPCFIAIYFSQVYSTAAGIWSVNELVDDVKTKSLGSLVTELTQKATGEVDKLYHQLEGVLGQLRGGWGKQETEARLDPSVLSDCSCYCRCPHDTVADSKVNEVKQSVLELKRRVESVGNTLKKKIHEFTSR